MVKIHGNNLQCRVTIPNRVIAKLKWKVGDILDYEIKDNTLELKLIKNE